MVESKNKAAPRARIAHKLARYYRALPQHLTGIKGANQPSTSHLRTHPVTQASEVPPLAELEMPTKPGTQVTTRRSASREHAKYPRLPRAGGPSSPDQSSSCSPARTRAAEWLYSRASSRATCW